MLAGVYEWIVYLYLNHGPMTGEKFQFNYVCEYRECARAHFDVVHFSPADE